MEKLIPWAVQSPARMKTRGKYQNGWPVGAVVHYTAGRDGAQKTINGGIEKGYTYLCIQKDGALVQAHPVPEWGYHAGESKWPGLGSSVHSKLIGVEINCAGNLKKQKDGTFKTWFGTTVPADQVRYSAGTDNQAKGYYEKYTPAQEATLVKLMLWLKAQNPDVFSFDYVLGHDEVAGMKGLGRWRKTDPGASLSVTMSEFRDRLKAEYAGKAPTPPPSPVVTAPAPLELSKRKQAVLDAMGSIGYGFMADVVVRFWTETRPQSNPRYWAFVDFGKPETKKRFMVVDADTGKVSTHLCAHGSGSDQNGDGTPETFSNVSGSHATSLGIFRVAETYNSEKFGYACRVDGLQKTNSNARARAIVIHKAWYVGFGGDTQGCFGLTPDDHKDVIDRLKDGSPLYAFVGS